MHFCFRLALGPLHSEHGSQSSRWPDWEKYPLLHIPVHWVVSSEGLHSPMNASFGWQVMFRHGRHMVLSKSDEKFLPEKQWTQCTFACSSIMSPHFHNIDKPKPCGHFEKVVQPLQMTAPLLVSTPYFPTGQRSTLPLFIVRDKKTCTFKEVKMSWIWQGSSWKEKVDSQTF